VKRISYCLTCVTTAVIIVGFSVGFVEAGTCILPVFDSDNFDSPQSNPYFPRDLNVTYAYEAETEDGFIRKIIYISSDTTTILGVQCIVVYDAEWIYVEEENRWYITKTTESWHAWDNLGNYWLFGEWATVFEYDDGWTLIGCNNDGSWTAGNDGALPGIIVPEYPSKPGTCFQQEYCEGKAEDNGKIQSLNGNISVAYMGRNFVNCMVIEEWTNLEPGNIEHKYYAPGAGLVYIEELKEKMAFFELADKYTGPPTSVPSSPPICP